MKRKFICLILAVLLPLLSIMPTLAETKGSTGTCALSVSGNSVTFNATNSSDKDEDTIRATAYLWELRSGVWYLIASTSRTLENTDYVSTSKTVTVSGGHYYKVTASFYRETNGDSYSSSAYTSQRWIGY